jgi:hypothetical protein
VRRSRLAVQRRVATKLERAAQQAKAQEEAETEKREKLQQVRIGRAEVVSTCAMCAVTAWNMWVCGMTKPIGILTTWRVDACNRSPASQPSG